ncbi:hypothetical protein [Lentibacillus amyloliquefaciens]|uniref:hypothetical protein n=1 Tax=Lentibacillus amyloliquefaciens TaxID=1472767 RepID=UPI0012E33149|nr:hypothetical protein [Lentibacillus amyloliquefaciens]
MRVQKGGKKDGEVRGGEAPGTGTYMQLIREELKKQANEEIRSVFFTGLFEQPL